MAKSKTEGVPAQDLPDTHENDQTETVLEQPDAAPDPEARQEAADKRLARGAERSFAGTTREAGSAPASSGSGSGSGSGGASGS